jgi:hypothetical protein
VCRVSACYRFTVSHLGRLPRTANAAPQTLRPLRGSWAHRNGAQSWSRGTFFGAPLDHFIGGAKMLSGKLMPSALTVFNRTIS